MTGDRVAPMSPTARLRSRARVIAPGLMADRARSYEREFRIRHGITALGERLASANDATVRTGPFAGLAYPPTASPMWMHRCQAGRLLRRRPR